MILASLWSRSNIDYVKYLCLALFSPLLIPLVFACFPFICALQLFLRLYRRRWRRKRRRGAAAAGMVGNDEFGNGQRLLQRYLDDQLILVVGSLYDQCGDADDEEEDAEEITGEDVECFDSQSPFWALGKH